MVGETNQVTKKVFFVLALMWRIIALHERKTGGIQLLFF